MKLEQTRIKLRNPHPLGIITGPGVRPAHANHLHLEEFSVVELQFQLVSGKDVLVGYADMVPETMENVLHVLTKPGETHVVRLASSMRELIVGDFGVSLSSEKESVLITVRY